MAHLANARSAHADFGGKHLDHKLVPEVPVGIRHSGQRSSTDESPQKSTHQTGGRGSAQSTSEEGTNEDDDEDGSAEKDDEKEDGGDDPEVVAPSHGFGLGKGKRPAIRIEPVGEDESPEADEETASHETGLQISKHPVNQALLRNNKRTFSNVSNMSVLFGESDDLTNEQQNFPRRKLARKLSNSSTRGLLTYKKNTCLEAMNDHDNAIESSDEEQGEKTIDVDDEDYSGVNLISDESDLEDVEQQEEDWIINDAIHVNELFQDARRLSLDSSASDNLFDPVNPLDESFFADNAFPDVGFGQFFEAEPLPTSLEPSASRKYSDSSTKRVRFDDEVQVSDSSSSSASELDGSLWPDLFMEQDKLPPNIYQMIENDDTDHADFPSSGSEHSYWDVGQDESHTVKLHESDEFDDSSDPGSSGYETDTDDDTDRDDSGFTSPPPQTPKQKTVLRRPSSAPGSKAASPKPFQRSTRPTHSGKLITPIRGVFVHEERNEAIAVTDRSTKTVTFYRPRVALSLRNPNYAAAYSSSTSTANNSPRTSFQQFNAEDSDYSEIVNNPFNSTTDIMLTGIFGAAPNNNLLFDNMNFGAPEAFYPLVHIGENGVIGDEYEYDEDDDEDFEDDVNIADFMDFGSDVDDATDVEDDEETDIPATPAISIVALNGSTPVQPLPDMETPTDKSRNPSDAMLEHFDRGVVTAFRNNQNRYRDIACLPHDPDLRASVSHPIRSGRSAETLISPLRKRGSVSRKSSASKFAGVTRATGKLHSSVMGSGRGPRVGTFSKVIETT